MLILLRVLPPRPCSYPGSVIHPDFTFTLTVSHPPPVNRSFVCGVAFSNSLVFALVFRPPGGSPADGYPSSIYFVMLVRSILR